MRKTVHDRCLGAGPGRSTYLEARTDRELQDNAKDLVAVELQLDNVELDGDARIKVTLRMEHVDGRHLNAEATRRLLPTALAEAFDAARAQLETPQARSRRAQAADDAPEDAAAR